MTIEVTASNINQLYGYLEQAYNNKQDYTITLDSSTPYEVSAYRAESTFYNPSPTYPYGPPGTERSSLPQIWSKVTIKAADGMFATITRDLSFAQTYRHFYVKGDGELILERLVIEKGDVGSADTGGGAILNKGCLLVRDCRLGPDNKSNYGGAILNLDGKTTLENCDVFDNEADWGGGLYNGFSNAEMIICNTRIANNRALQSWAIGGGIANLGGDLTVEHCAIFENQANSGGGIAVYDSVANVSVKNSIIRKNTAWAKGGGVYAQNSGSPTIECSVLTDNNASQGDVAWQENFGNVTLLNCWLDTGNIGNATITTRLEPRYPEFEMRMQLDATMHPVYVYNRSQTAEAAVLEIRDTFHTFPFGNGNLTGGVVGQVGGPFTYPSGTLNHTGQKTGSATFISERLFIGGLPMTFGLVNGQVDTNDCDQDGGSATSGWHICDNDPVGATQSWLGHQSLIDYIDAIGGSFVGSLSTNAIDPYFNFTTGGVDDEQALYDLFNSGGDYESVNTGDYIFIDQGTLGGHGFLIVGWGPAASVADSVNALLPGELDANRVQISLQKISNTVPYVVDFAYGYNGVSTGWLQDMRPRPFYTSAVNLSIASFDANVVGYVLDDGTSTDYESRLRGGFGAFIFQESSGACAPPAVDCRPAWQFYRLPNEIDIPVERIYHYPCVS